MNRHSSRKNKIIHIQLKRHKSTKKRINKNNQSFDERVVPSTNENNRTQISRLDSTQSKVCETSPTSAQQFKTEDVSSCARINLDFSLKTKGSKPSTIHPYIELDHPFVVLKKKKKPIPCGWKLFVYFLIALLIAGIILAIVLPLVMKQTATTTTTVLTTTLAPICSLSTHSLCSTVIFQYLNLLYIPPGSWTPISCCYIAPISNQLTFEIAVQVDDSGYWRLDDISAQQKNGELISNGGFESNLTNWTLTTYANVTTFIIEPDFLSLTAQSGVTYLYASSANARSYLRQTFSVVPGENVLINFFWDYFPAFGFPFGISELIVTST